VDDEPDIAMSLTADLRRQGHDTEVVRDGEQAVAVAARPGWDLILLDVMLPKMDGFDVCTELRRLGIKTPIIMLTARTQDTEKEVGLESRSPSACASFAPAFVRNSGAGSRSPFASCGSRTAKWIWSAVKCVAVAQWST
jgi:CheY-like chemotaxis protein